LAVQADVSGQRHAPPHLVQTGNEAGGHASSKSRLDAPKSASAQVTEMVSGTIQ
jgi:hypothetical protein